MSVTLKIADEDAKLVASIMEEVAKIQDASIHGRETVVFLRRLEILIPSDQGVKRVLEIGGAFKTAARANER